MELLDLIGHWMDIIVDFLNLLYEWLGKLLNKETT